MQIPDMLRSSEDRKRWQKKDIVRMHKRAGQKEVEQNLKRRRDRLGEEGWFSQESEEGRPRKRAQKNEQTAQMDIEARVTMYDENIPWESLSSYQPKEPHYHQRTYLPKLKD
jgi:hypothetical protein